ncbi:orotate phosphoribosyltransferase [Candidatus Poriferisocius sp.]|uniref:orotate phosphoribosyltransferase n=1 Tax=Candidatus Poriferisocius sp. TaxID=3101276 RepID=UPI003B01624F
MPLLEIVKSAGLKQMDEGGESLLDIVKRAGLKQMGEPVKLACGAMSSDFIDMKQALCDWKRLEVACRAIVERVHEAGIDFDAAGGMTMGADPLAVGIASMSNCRWFSVRKAPKNRGTNKLIEGTSLEQGVRVLLLDDITTTGSSALTALQAVLETGAEVVAAATIVDRGSLARQAFDQQGVPYFPILTYADLDIDPVIPPG